MYKKMSLVRIGRFLSPCTRTLPNSIYISANISLYANPQVSLYDTLTKVRVEGLQPSKPVSLKTEMAEDSGKLFCANAYFITDKNGVVDTTTASSVGGSYTGVFPSGLFSCMKVASGKFKYGRIHKNDMHTPFKIKVSVLNGHMPIDDETPALDSIIIEKHLLGKGVQRIPVNKGNIRGVLYIPDGEGPFPGVIDMFGASGSLIETRAALNASRGLASFSLAYFNYEDLPWEKIYNLDLTYFEEATEYLISHPLIKPEKCGVVGNCFGGFYAYMMGLHLEKVKAVFLINTSFHPFFGKFSYKGEIIAKNPYFSEIGAKPGPDGILIPTGKFKESFETLTSSVIDDFSEFPMDKHLVVTCGKGDSFQFHNGWEKLLSTSKCKENISFKTYPNAGHLISPPYTPFAPVVFAKLWSNNPDYENGKYFQFGGEAKGTVSMQEDTWEWMFDFFTTRL